ncbi:TnsD family Tn7-like transposition protein [Paenibacillus sp. FSL M7-0420]|uniref:TnsD family Tn7-like transposition protein n=1 Tax=Paenibacillus sp. FSL M7-0420 TaxID=2921609 RepID=UPI0030F8C2A2
MIFFPPPFPDELLYSVCARYHARSGNENVKLTMRDLFGKRSVCAVTDFPGHLNDLYLRIPRQAISIATLLNNHTLLPYFRPYISPERYEGVTEDMVYGDGRSIYMKMGLVANGVKPLFHLRYCTSCVKENREVYGVAYWHRCHQLTGVDVCPVHNSCLQSSSIQYAQRRNKHEFVMLESIVGSLTHQICSCEIDTKLLVAKKSEFLLNMNYPSINTGALRKIYLGRLNEMGMLTANGHIRFQDLLPKFESFFGQGYLFEQGCVVDKKSQYSWLHKILRKPRHAVHPLRHILLQLFLDIDVSEILQKKHEGLFHPFGEGPWPCLNRGAEHFGEHIISNVRISRCYDTGKPVGTFSCNCGFVYSRRGPDITLEDLTRIGRIKHFGSTWIEKLIELNSNGALSLREKARQLGVDAGTIKRQTYLLKTEGEKGIQKNSNSSNAYSPKAYSPKVNNCKEKTTYIKIRVDWRKRDEFLTREINRIVDEMKNLGVVRVSRNEIGRRLQCSTMIRTQINKLPLTKIKLEEITRKSIKVR